ncbi:hypothetical protein [Homoserinimonas sp. OAct 916]|uniref:hypothetical protein n=1 Tax=Homoserinimonas sp. OAct 916 TaxID=2211450 RepID=UPI000DBE4792|nr:hypothetical protein [Homoserinimonas sp. OAct 916]
MNSDATDPADRPDADSTLHACDESETDADTVLVNRRTDTGTGSDVDTASRESAEEYDDEPTRIVVRRPRAVAPAPHPDVDGYPSEIGAPQSPDDDQTRIVARKPRRDDSVQSVAPAAPEDDATRVVSRKNPADVSRPDPPRSDLDDETMIVDRRGRPAQPGWGRGATVAGPPQGLISGGRVYEAPDVVSGAKQAQPRRNAERASVDRVEVPITSSTLPAPAEQLRAGAEKRGRRRGCGVLAAVVLSTILVASAAAVAIWLILAFAA